MFARSKTIFRIAGFDIRLDPSWLLIAALITWSLGSNYFPISAPGFGEQTYLVMAIVAMLLFFGSLLLHEMAHALVARRYGLPIKKITLFLFGGVAELEAEPKTAAAEFWVALAGPAMSFALGFTFWVMSGVTHLVSGASPVTAVLTYLALINVILAVFNLLPAFPLDGGRVLRAYLWNRHGDMLRATETAARAGEILAYVLMGLGLLALFRGAVITALWQIMIGGFILAAARSSYQSQLARAVFDHKSVGDLMTREPVVAGPDMTLTDFVNRIMLRHRVSFVPVVENGVLLGHVDQSVLAGIDRENWGGTRVGDVFAGLEPDGIVTPDLPVEELMSRIAETGQRKYLVVRDKRLLGVITLADLTHYLRLAETLRLPLGHAARKSHP